jgi:hypothetical protein
MSKTDLTRDSLREGLKEKGRRRRKASDELASASYGRAAVRNDLLPALQVKSYSTDSLRSPARRVRKADSAHIREIANSIRAFGFNVPVLIGRDNTVLDGASRLEAARQIGLSTVPGIRVDHLNATEQRLLRLAVNRLAEKGTWDLEELKAEFNELIIEDAPIELSGFGLDEVDQLVIGDRDEATESRNLEPVPGTLLVTRVGDLFRLGPHRLICGDSSNPEVVRRLMQTDVARLIFTDEPFNVAIGGHVTGGEHREFVMASGEMTDTQFLEFNRRWIGALLPHLIDGGLFGTFIDWRGLPIVHAAATELGLAPLNLIVWARQTRVWAACIARSTSCCRCSKRARLRM